MRSAWKFGPSGPFFVFTILHFPSLSLGFRFSFSARKRTSIFREKQQGRHPIGMLYKITIEPSFLKAELFNRQTMEETREFLRVVAVSAIKHGRPSVLISVRSSNPVFTVERSGFLAYFKKLTANPSHKIALVGDTEEIGISHQYVEFIGRQNGANVRSFQDETAALQWFETDGR